MELQVIWLPTARRAIDLHRRTLNSLADSPRGVQMKGNVVNSLKLVQNRTSVQWDL